MELITQMAETQKVQETKLEELKSSVERLQEELEDTREGKLKVECLWKEARDELKDVKEKYEKLLEKSRKAKEMYDQELDSAKQQWNSMEIELKTTSEEIIGEMRKLEDKNKILENKLAGVEETLFHTARNETFLHHECEKLKAEASDKAQRFTRLEAEKEKTTGELHSVKMQLLKERNVLDRVVEEAKRLKKDVESRNLELDENRREKEELKIRIAELNQLLANNRSLEVQLKELRSSANMILQRNNSIDEKISTLSGQLRSETNSTGIQTDMTHTDIDKYDHLDRQATLLVVGLKEELLNLKHQYLETRQENDLLKNVVNEIKRERDVKEENERVGRLEDAVRALSDSVRQELFFEPTRETTILKALQDVKNDLNTLKKRRNVAPSSHQRGDETVVLPAFSNQTYDPSVRPTKLVTFRNGH